MAVWTMTTTSWTQHSPILILPHLGAQEPITFGVELPRGLDLGTVAAVFLCLGRLPSDATACPERLGSQHFAMRFGRPLRRFDHQ